MINKSSVLVSVIAGVAAGGIAAVLFQDNAQLIIYALFAGFIAFSINAWFELNRMKADQDKLEEKLRGFSQAVVTDLSNMTESISDEFDQMSEDVGKSFHELALLIAKVKYGPESEEGED